MYGALNKISFSSQFIVSNFSLTQTAFCCFYWRCTTECPFMYVTQLIRRNGQLLH